MIHNIWLYGYKNDNATLKTQDIHTECVAHTHTHAHNFLSQFVTVVTSTRYCNEVWPLSSSSSSTTMIHAIHFYSKMNKTRSHCLGLGFSLVFLRASSLWVDLSSSKCANNTLIAHAILTINANTDTCHIKCIQANSLFNSFAYTIHCECVFFLVSFNLFHIYAISHRHRQRIVVIYFAVRHNLCHLPSFFSLWLYCRAENEM